MNPQRTHYISPLLMLDLKDKTSFDKKDMLLAKKKMLAELELSGGTTIDIKGKAFSKNDIVVFFDQLHQTEELAYHQAVAADTTLLHFLEGRGLLLLHRFAPNSLYSQPDFIAWVSPYFSLAFSKAAKECFKKPDVEGWDYLMKLPLLMDLRHQEKCWMVLETAIQENIDYLKEMHDSGKAKQSNHAHVVQIEKLCDYRLINMILQLPESRFASQRDEYAFEMMQVLIDLFNANNRSFAMDTLRNGNILAHSGYMQQQLQDKYDEMQGILRNKSYAQPRQKSTSDWGGARVILFVVVIIFRLITCAKEENRSDNYSQNIVFEDYGATLRQQEAEERVRQSKMDNPAGKAIQQFTNAIFHFNPKMSDSSQIKSFVTGDDPYGYLWGKMLGKNTGVAANQIPFELVNASSFEAIVFITNDNGMKSVYLKPSERVVVHIAEHYNAFFTYLGQNFRIGERITYTDTIVQKEISARGMFTKNIGLNKQWLKKPVLYLPLKKNGSAGKLEISGGEDDLAAITLHPD